LVSVTTVESTGSSTHEF